MSECWLHNPCYMRGRDRFKAGQIVTNGPLVCGLASYPLPNRGPQHFKARDKDSHARKWVHSIHIPRRLSWGGGAQFFKAWKRVINGTSRPSLGPYPMQLRGSPSFQSKRQNWQWPPNGRIGHITPADKGVPNPLEHLIKLAVPRCTLENPNSFQPREATTSRTKKWGGLPLPTGERARGYEGCKLQP